MKTAISVPDEVFREAERAAKRLGISRSELVTRALREFLEKRTRAEIRASYDRAFADDPSDDDLKQFRRAATRRVAKKARW